MARQIFRNGSDNGASFGIFEEHRGEQYSENKGKRAEMREWKLTEGRKPVFGFIRAGKKIKNKEKT